MVVDPAEMVIAAEDIENHEDVHNLQRGIHHKNEV